MGGMVNLPPVKGIGDRFYRNSILERTITPLTVPSVVIHKSAAIIAVSGDIPERILSQIMRRVLYVCRRCRHSPCCGGVWLIFIVLLACQKTGCFICIPRKE